MTKFGRREDCTGTLPGFSLLETLLVLAMIGVILGTSFLSLDGLIERWHLSIAKDRVLQTLKYAQFLSLTQRQTHQISGKGTQLWIHKRGNSQDEFSWETLPDDLLLHVSRWPSFSPYGFAKAGTIYLESSRYSTQIIVSTIGSIRSTEIQAK
ncbi:MAG: prepilin-type N-terminal cleavage/methylation domain-containing protein [SAR324 cluster bacterium]|nr:prepilin-type N-terminal cleavage/methylation domain-containing protein [SAR324 cluster bacterium]